jgi:alanine-glyoxylate transaminase/serine-glyoxylate transaminase/serine-pyruvate transaminase
MPNLPDAERLLLGPGPSPVAPRITRAMMAPPLSHLDADMMALLGDVSSRLARVLKASHGSFSFAVSGTGSAGMEAVVANLVRENTVVAAVVNGYFGDRLAATCERAGARVRRVVGTWGRAIDPDQLRRALQADGADVVAMVHAETSTGVCNPVDTLCGVAREFGAVTIVDTVTSLGGMPVDVASWQADGVYSCSQKGLGAPSGLAPVTLSARALEQARRTPSRSFYFDLALLHDYWTARKYHHTISAPLIYALREALLMAEEEGIEARWARHQRNHALLARGLTARGLSLLPPEAEQLWTLNAVRVPDDVDEAGVRKTLLERFSIEIGAGLGPLAGKIWRIGLMGSGSSEPVVVLLLGALAEALRAQGFVAGEVAVR